MKEILNALRKRGDDGIKWADAQKQMPFSKYNRKQLEDILRSLEDAELATVEEVKGGRGRPSHRWYALK